MDIRRSASFNQRLATELAPEDRPSLSNFETQLGSAVELTLSSLWDDSSYVVVVDRQADIRAVVTVPVRPFMFPPGVFYARRADDNTIELIDVEFDWDFWNED